MPPRQPEVFQLLAAGGSAKEIATGLLTSMRTVEFHKYQMTEMLDPHTDAGLIHLAIKHSLVKS